MSDDAGLGGFAPPDSDIEYYRQEVDRMEARIRRLRAVIREMNNEINELEGESIFSASAIERNYYPTIERGDMTEE